MTRLVEAMRGGGTDFIGRSILLNHIQLARIDSREGLLELVCSIEPGWLWKSFAGARGDFAKCQRRQLRTGNVEISSTVALAGGGPNHALNEAEHQLDPLKGLMFFRSPQFAPRVWFVPIAGHRRSHAGMTLLEVMIAMAIFVVASIGITAGYFMLNTRATRVRVDAVACSILRAKIAKDMTDPWISNSTPVDCVLTSGSTQTVADPNDPYDVGPTVTLLDSSDSPTSATISGTLYRNTYSMEAAAKTVVIDYSLTYTFRGKSYTDYASTVRARDY
jgi:prepilin-type N-terminal cleavage/methylation domain-containing protein